MLDAPKDGLSDFLTKDESGRMRPGYLGQLAASLAGELAAINVARLAEMLDEHKDGLSEFLTKDERGRMIPGYLGALAASLTAEHAAILGELSDLGKNIEHSKDIA